MADQQVPQGANDAQDGNVQQPVCAPLQGQQQQQPRVLIPAQNQLQPQQHLDAPQGFDEQPGTPHRHPHDQHPPHREPNYGRVIKTFKIEPFSGSVDQGAIDSGVAGWFKRFETLLSMQENLHQVRLPENMKNALLFQLLSGVASQWYISEFDDLRDRSLSSLGRALKREFGSKLSKAQIGEMVANERKKATETYREYSLRLRDMAASTASDGFETVESNKLALSSFITNAWRKHSDNLRMVIREDTRYPVHEMGRAVSKLCTISGHQGSLTFPQRQPAQMKSSVADARSIQGKRKATEETGRNEKRFKRRDYSKGRCGTCGELGHTTGYHDRSREPLQSENQVFDPGVCDGAPIIDSGSTCHITGTSEKLFDLHECEPHAVEIANGGLVCGNQKGKMVIDQLKGTVLDNVVYAPGFKQTLISVKQLIDAGMKVEFTNEECLIYDKPVLRGPVHRGVYTLPIPRAKAACVLRPNSIEDWHQRLGHLNYKSIADLAKSGAVKGLHITGSTSNSKACEVCALSKISRAHAPQRASRSIQAQNEVCHGDLAGPFARSYHGNHYYLVLKWMGHTTVYFLKKKNEAAKCFQHYINIVIRRFSKLQGIKIFRSDNGGEFAAGPFRKICADEGIIMEAYEPEVHHQNGVIERTNRTIGDTARSLMLQAKLPHYLWQYAVRSAVYARNRVLFRSDPNKTPFEKFWGRKPDLKMIKTFGQHCVVLVPPQERSTAFKFRPKGRSGIFIGSDPQRKGYFIYVSGNGNRVIHSRSVVFLEPPSIKARAVTVNAQNDPMQVVNSESDDEDSQILGPCGSNNDTDHPRQFLTL